MMRNPLCMWSLTGVGPTGISAVCSSQASTETVTLMVTECDEDGKVVEVYYEVLEPMHAAAAVLREQLFGDGYYQSPETFADVWYLRVRGEH